MSAWVTELRYAARGLRNSPGVAALAVLALALGLGLTTTMFSIVEGAILRGLPFEGAGRIMHLERNNLSEGIESMEVPLHDYLDWREQQRSFEALAAFHEGTVNLSGTERAERYDGAFITANGLETLGVRPTLGRLFREDEDEPEAGPVLLLSDHVWRDRFDADTAVLGRVLRVNGEQATVIGVMPPGFRFPTAQDVWLPLRMDPAKLARGEGTSLEVFGRLRDGVSRDRAAAEMQTIARRLAEAYPETNEGVGAVVKPFTDEYIGEEPRAMLWTMLGAVFLVLLIACANVANLLLARAATRQRELAIRSAIGASRLQVIGKLLAEALVLAGAGAALGLALAWVGIRAFNAAVAPSSPPFWIDIGLHPQVLLFVLAVTLASALLSGIVPALQATGARLNEVLKDESRGSSGLRVGRLSRVLVTAEIALSVGLLVGTGLMIKSVTNLAGVEYGFETESVFSARMGLFEADYPDAESRGRYYERLLPRLRELPGVEAATIATSLPGVWSGGTTFEVEGRSYERPQDHPNARWVAIAPGYFEAFDVRPLRGRRFDLRDAREAAAVAIVNRSFVARHFPGEDPLGKRIRQGGSEDEEPWRTIVGVVPDMHLQGVQNPEDDPSGMYVPLAQADPRFTYVALRSGGDAMTLANPARAAVAAVDPDIPLYWVQSVQAAIDETTWYYRVFGTLFAVFGAVALFLASVGLYGVMSASVGSRTVEMGIRMALGAKGKDVVRLVLRQGLVQIAIGLAVGVGLAFLLARGLDILLYRVGAWDPATFLLIAAVIVATGLLASWIPALRATRVEPMTALRYE